MFGFSRKNAEVLSHWYSVIDGFQCSSQEFYAEIEKELAARKVPGLTLLRVDFAEGGILSDKRTYLRMLRERLVFDVCAAPFGRAYFFSLRFAEIPAVIHLWQVFACLGLLAVVFWIVFKLLGFFMAPFVFIGLVILGIWIARNAVSLGLDDLDASLIKSPVFGPIYERYFRKETYYRQDTRMLYHTIVMEVVKTQVDIVTSAKGVKLLRSYDFNPVLGELYKMSETTPGGTTPAA
jgi:hypothetical protein